MDRFTRLSRRLDAFGVDHCITSDGKFLQIQVSSSIVEEAQDPETGAWEPVRNYLRFARSFGMIGERRAGLSCAEPLAGLV